jgi:tetratricopeptide (TPR) repeat protein
MATYTSKALRLFGGMLILTFCIQAAAQKSPRGTKAPAEQPPPASSVPGTAIEIYRPGRFMCKDEYIPVIIDDKEVGRIQSGRFLTARVVPGTHTVRGDQTPPVQVGVKTDQVAFVRFRYDHIGGWCQHDGVGVAVMTPDDAQRELAGLKPSDARYIYATDVAPAPVAAAPAAMPVMTAEKQATPEVSSVDTAPQHAVHPNAITNSASLPASSATALAAAVPANSAAEQQTALPAATTAVVREPVLHLLEQVQAALHKAVSPGDICPENYFKSSTFSTHVFYYNWDISQISATETGFRYTQTIKWSTGWGWRHDAGAFGFRFVDLKDVTVAPAGSEFRVTLQLPNDSKRSMFCSADGQTTWLVWKQKEDADAFAEAVNWMIWQSSPEGRAKIARQKRTEEAFRQQLAAWRAATEKPKMPDEAHVHEVLARSAVEEKNLSRATDEYEAALEIFPTWPEGQFNLALICGETSDYDCAVEHMQNYLELVPDAADAQAAKDKLIVWRDKLTHSQ